MTAFRLALCALLLPSTIFAQALLVKPYVQPGDGSSLQGRDVKVLIWLTEHVPADYTVEYSVAGAPPKKAASERVSMDFRKGKEDKTPAPSKPGAAADIPVTAEDLKKDLIKEASPYLPEREQHYFRYTATLPDLPFDSDVTYRVRQGATLIGEGKFRTRASANKPIRFVMVGDLANGQSQQNAVAFHIAQAKPEFMVLLGDIVYSSGRVSQYLHHFFPSYCNPTEPGLKTGAPLMQTIPFYPVIGNHDADMERLHEKPDVLGAYYFFSGPLNGPGVGPWNTPLGKDPALADAFRKTVGPTYPALNIYSFDYGPAHFVMLDTNSYNTASFMQIAPWVEKDLKESKQPWKFVCMHAPSFHTSPQHYAEQKMRLLEPIFRENGVNVVFAGHVHNYQRSKPLAFTPNPGKRDNRGRVNGDYVFDDEFDGVTKTVPKGIIHIVSGGGGAGLYNAKDFEKTIAQLAKEHAGNYIPLTAKYVADKHSFTLIELTPQEFVLKQITLEGLEVDRFKITKEK
jgi:hypothetical protein